VDPQKVRKEKRKRVGGGKKRCEGGNNGEALKLRLSFGRALTERSLILLLLVLFACDGVLQKDRNTFSSKELLEE
jgi:hypothetical protein